MQPAWPRYLLFADATESSQQSAGWRFVLSAIDSQHTISVEDVEQEAVRSERLALMAALRGLEALDQPSVVTLVCPSRYVRRGFAHGLKQWREGGWKWECFGRRVLVRDHDLWRRVDRTLQFHRVDCRSWRFESGDAEARNAVATKNASDSRVSIGRVEAARQMNDWPASRINNDAALLVCSPPRRARRGVIRFDEPATSDAAYPASPAIASAG